MINVYSAIIYVAIVTAILAKSQLPLISIMLTVSFYNEGKAQ